MLPVLTNASWVLAKVRCASATRSPAGDSPAGVEPPSRWDGTGAAAVLISFWVTGLVAVTAEPTIFCTAGSGVTAGAFGSVVGGGMLCHTGCTEPHEATMDRDRRSSNRCTWS